MSAVDDGARVLRPPRRARWARGARGVRGARGATPSGLLALAALLCGCSGPALPDGSGVSVLLVTLDTTRADHVGAYGEQQVETPTLDRLAREGVLFTDATTAVPLTLPAHASIMTGRYPIDHGIHDNGSVVLRPAAGTLAELLRGAGFSTAAVVGAYVLEHSWGLDRGFDLYDDRFGGRAQQAGGDAQLERDAGEVADRALEWLGRLGEDERFFLWLHFYDPHHPYDPPPPYAARYPGRPYAGEIAHTDAELGRVVARLRARGSLESTLVIVVGDHGEALDEHGEPDHGIFLYQPTMRVPLIVRSPGGQVRGRVDELVRHVDLLPTVMELLGLPIPEGGRGRSLWPLMLGEAAGAAVHAYGETFYTRFHYGWSELRSLRDGRYKYVQAPTPELYDLDEDPGETFNLAEVHPGIAGDLATRLERLVAAEQPADVAAAQAIDPSTLDRLRSLGYVGSVVTVPGGTLADPKDRTASLPLFSRVGFQGPRALREGNYESALRMVEEALEAEPNYLDGWLIKAEALRKLARFPEALEVLERALALNPDNVTTLHELAECHRLLGDSRTALDVIARLHLIAPGYPGAYLTAADIHVEEQRLDAALAELETLLERQPESARGHYELGLLHLVRGELVPAERRIRRALELQPRLFSAHFNLALIAEHRRDAAGARAEYLAELEQFPRNHEAWANLGILQIQAGETEPALESFGKVVELAPELPTGYLMLARTRQLQGRVDDETLRLVRRALELDPDSTAARGLLQELQR